MGRLALAEAVHSQGIKVVITGEQSLLTGSMLLFVDVASLIFLQERDLMSILRATLRSGPIRLASPIIHGQRYRSPRTTVRKHWVRL
jgi:hypothetical protein